MREPFELIDRIHACLEVFARHSAAAQRKYLFEPLHAESLRDIVLI